MRYAFAFSRHPLPEFFKNLRPLQTEGATRPSREGAGKTGCALHPRSRVQMCSKEHAHEHTGSAEAVRPSLRNGFTAYFVLSPATGLFVTVTREKRQLLADLNSSIGASGPHHFAGPELHRSSTRINRATAQPRPPHPVPTLVTMADAPLCGTGRR